MNKNILITIVASVCATLLVGGFVTYGYIFFSREGARKEVTTPIPIGNKTEVNTPTVSNIPMLSTIDPTINAPVTTNATKETQQEIQSNTPLATTSSTNLSEFSVAKFIPTVVKLECFGVNDTEPFSSGSGISFYGDDGFHYIATNAHVVRAYDGSIGGCWVYFPDKNGYFYELAYWAGEVYVFDNKIVSINGELYGGTTYEQGGLDNALLILTDPGVDTDGSLFPSLDKATFPNLNAISEETCTTNDLTIGDQIWVLGYPGIGGDNLTVTEGIISGFSGDYGEYIKTSAKVEHGNSGGIAIRAKDGCLLGIPTQGVSGSMETISSILSYSFMSTFFDALSGADAIDYNFLPVIEDPYDIPLWEDLPWKEKTSVDKTTQSKMSKFLTFGSACVAYSNYGCNDYRIIDIPTKSTDGMYTAEVESKNVPYSNWMNGYYNVVDYYDLELAQRGFKRGDTVFIPDLMFALTPEDLGSSEDAYAGGVFRYVRVLDDEVQVVLLVADVYLENASRTCTDGGSDCKADVIEDYILYVGSPVTVNTLLALMIKTKDFVSTGTQFVGSIVQAVQGINIKELIF